MILYPNTTPFKTALVRTSAPDALPVDLELVANYVRTDVSDDVTEVESLIDFAVEFAEHFTERAMLNATYRYTLSGWPKTPNGYTSRIIELPRSPLVSVTSVKYYDTNNTLQTLSSSYYLVGTDFEPGCVYLQTDYDWPDLYTRPDAVQITFVAGAGTSVASVSPSLKRAMLLLCRAHFAGGNPNTNASPEDDMRAAVRLLNTQKVGGWTA